MDGEKKLERDKVVRDEVKQIEAIQIAEANRLFLQQLILVMAGLFITPEHLQELGSMAAKSLRILGYEEKIIKRAVFEVVNQMVAQKLRANVLAKENKDAMEQAGARG